MEKVSTFWTLSRSERLKVVYRAAKEALKHYALDVMKTRLYAWETNALFRIDTPDKPLIMRIASPNWRTHENLVSEALWLDALREAPGVNAPSIVPAVTGDLVCTVWCPECEIALTATVMSWQPGRLLGYYLTPANLKKMGRLFAKLHVHGAAWKRPAGFSPQVFDSYLSRGEPNRITDLDHPSGLSKADITLIHCTIQLVEDAYSSIDRDDLRVIHCDLWHDNIKIHKGILYPFDFEDTILGFRLHDIAMAMLDLFDDAGERYPELLCAFRTGYRELLDWPEGNMGALQAGRILWILNYVAGVEPQHLKSVMAKRREQLENIVGGREL